MHIPTAALSALSATCLFVGSHAQASADCQALTAKFIVQVACQAAAAPSASARCCPRARSDGPRARWPYCNWGHSPLANFVFARLPDCGHAAIAPRR